MRAFKVLAGAVVAALIIIGLSSASAVSLPIVSTNNLKILKAASCSTASVAVSANASSQITVTGIASACSALPIYVQLNETGTPSTITVSSAVSGTSMTFAQTLANPSNVTAAFVFINNWSLPATWSYTPTTSPYSPVYISPTTPNTTVNVTWTQNAPTQFCGAFNVTSTSSTAVAWQVVLSVNNPPFNTDLNTGDYQFTPFNGYQFVSTTPVNGLFYIVGNMTGTSTVSSSAPINFTICDYSSPAPVVSTNPAVVYITTQTQAPTASYYVCKTEQVSVTGSPLFVGWQTNIDVSDLRALYIPGTGGQEQGPFGGFSATHVSGNTYTISGTGYNTQGVNNTNPVSFQICWG
jgi:hypothetical protein